MVPFLLVLAATACADLHRSPRRWLRAAAVTLILVVLSYSAAYAIAADLQFTNDSRYAAQQWVIEHLPRGARIETTSYGPDLPLDEYTVVERPHDNHVGGVAHALDQSPSYQRYRSVTAPVRRWLGTLGIDGEERYVPWSQKADRRYGEEVIGFDLSVGGLARRAPDLFIASDLYTTRFIEGETLEGTFFAALDAGSGPFREVARFHYRLPTWLRPAPEFVNPVITIYAQGRS
jgi:hypothetical protein